MRRDRDKELYCNNLEQTLAPGGVCCLGSLNLTQFVKPSGEFDFAKFEKYTAYMVRFLDNVNEYSDAPLPEYVDSMRNKRRVGVGIMGWGSMLLMMKIKFGSEKAGQLRDKIMKMLAQTTYKASIDLAVEKGMFKYCDPVKHAAGKFANSLDLSEEYMEKLRTTGIRNSSLISVQPTGNCQTADTKIITSNGEVTIGEMVGKDNLDAPEGVTIQLHTPMLVDTLHGQESVTQVYVNGHHEVFSVKTVNGDEVKSTGNHRYLVRVNETTAEWVPVCDLRPGMHILSK